MSSPQSLEQMIADAERVRHRGQRRVDRADRREDARVGDVEVVELVRAAVDLQLVLAGGRPHRGHGAASSAA
jgi:hypothetical protein